jgi:hypothetical protein
VRVKADNAFRTFAPLVAADDDADAVLTFAKRPKRGVRGWNFADPAAACFEYALEFIASHAERYDAVIVAPDVVQVTRKAKQMHGDITWTREVLWETFAMWCMRRWTETVGTAAMDEWMLHASCFGFAPAFLHAVAIITWNLPHQPFTALVLLEKIETSDPEPKRYRFGDSESSLSEAD